MEPQLAFTKFLNLHFAGMATSLLTELHVHVEFPRAAIPNSFAMELIVMGVLLVFFLLVRANLSVENPGPIQHLGESYYEFIDNQGREIIDHGHARFMPFAGALGLFIVVGNLLGMIPGLASPTGYIVVTLGCAITVFIYYNFHGFREQGIVGYVKHFMGPVWWLAFLIFPIEIISHVARMLSLSVRLYANMLAGDLLILVFFSIFPFGVPLIFLGLHLGVALIQAYLFMVLAMIYIAQAVSHDTVTA
jgi:F-type H+-transporting ATPase subunit a